MHPSAPALTFLLLALSALWSCSPAPQAKAPPPAPPPVAAAPAKMMKMVCRNSQTGGNAECGTPNAVMVGMKAE